jgi:hypothetical protein
MMKRLEHNVTTGEVVEIEMTEEEVEHFNAEAEAEASRIASISVPTVTEKLASVGLSIEELREAILGGN